MGHNTDSELGFQLDCKRTSTLIYSIHTHTHTNTDTQENHAKACVAAGKPCLLEEYGTETTAEHCPIDSAWAATSLASEGQSADMYWQYGTTISSGETSNDGYTIYTGTSDFTCVVTDHIADIAAA